MSIESYFKSRPLVLLSIIATASILIHFLLRSKIPGSALLYVGIPFLISVLLLTFTKKIEQPTWKQKFINHIRDALIVMMGSSVILFEGFVCVVMFMPIYFSIMLINFIITAFNQHKKEKAKLNTHFFSALILMVSLEGIHPNLSFERYNEVSSTKIVNANITDIKKNLVKPVNLQDDRAWFLDLFPMPYQVNNNSLIINDIHEIKYRYHRWFITNTHEGHTLLKIAEVGDNYIRTEFIEDTSYISNYMKLHGTEIRFKPIDASNTEVTLTIKYDRMLDPVWYFGPLQKYGVKKKADYLIAKMME